VFAKLAKHPQVSGMQAAAFHRIAERLQFAHVQAVEAPEAVGLVP
jgi:hypothetical protein